MQTFDKTWACGTAVIQTTVHSYPNFYFFSLVTLLEPVKHLLLLLTTLWSFSGVLRCKHLSRRCRAITLVTYDDKVEFTQAATKERTKIKQIERMFVQQNFSVTCHKPPYWSKNWIKRTACQRHLLLSLGSRIPLLKLVGLVRVLGELDVWLEIFTTFPPLLLLYTFMHNHQLPSPQHPHSHPLFSHNLFHILFSGLRSTRNISDRCS